MKYLGIVCYLIVLVAISADAETEFICQFTSKTLACRNGKSLDIKFANYGRIGHNVCSRGGYRSGADRINNCYDESHTDLVGMLCNGQTTCVLPASNEVFGDTCPGVLKYLQVKYHCI
ncbi:hypothetical protein GHT06_016154 [Daphnia sinensis]|uniref:SUEL-type lectin domain-containing protein n=1 Tax=Daphnia sinensis TaxID=1820382 RepID=A0AAD5PXW1_9CRUS|nr:hypothetical protein GHT06_016154 [Daphnia sinensis]